MDFEKICDYKIAEYNEKVNKVFGCVSKDMENVMNKTDILEKKCSKLSRKQAKNGFNLVILGAFTVYSVYKIAGKFATIEAKIEEICDTFDAKMNCDCAKTGGNDDLK